MYRYNEYHDLIFNSNSRYTLWCITDTGPFKNTLMKTNLVGDNLCGYCFNAIKDKDHFSQIDVQRYGLDNSK